MFKDTRIFNSGPDKSDRQQRKMSIPSDEEVGNRRRRR
jgi:hypothetical protein